MISHPRPQTLPRATSSRRSTEESAPPPRPHSVPGDDTELLASARAGSADAVATLWERHWQTALSCARFLARREDPEELAAEAMSRVLQAISRGGGPTHHFSAYLKHTIRNLALTRARRPLEVCVEPEILVVLSPLTPSAETSAESRALAHEVHATIARLPERYRAALVFNELEGRSMREWAPRLNISEGAAAALASRARRAFRKAWLDSHPDARGAVLAA